MTYVSSYYHYFAKMKSEQTGTKRIAKVIGGMLDMQHMQEDYETLVSNLLEWIYNKIDELDDRHFPNSLDGVQQQVTKFKNYRVAEKPAKYRERGNIEAHFFNIQAKLKSGGRKMYVPPEGRLIRDIETGWVKLEKSEYDRELALREEMIRQERLERLAEKFERKAGLRDSWLNDMIMVLSDQNFGTNIGQVEAALKKHEAISADVEARRDRFTALSNMASELNQENYHHKDDVSKREQQISAKWQHLMELLEKKRRTLTGFNDLLTMFREIDGITNEMKSIESQLHSDDTGKHLNAVEDLLQKHNIVELELNSIGNRLRNLNKRAQPHMKSLHPEAQLLVKRLDPLNKEFENLHNLSQGRKAALENSRTFFQFLQDCEEEETWLVEKTRLVKSQDVGKDLISCMLLMKKHEALEQEMAARSPRCEQVCEVGEQLIRDQHYAKKDIRNHVDTLHDMWKKLRDLTALHKTRLDDAAESHQYYADANEAESWMREKMPLVCSDDFGKDEPTAKNLLQRHGHLEEEIKAFQEDVKRLDELATLMTKAANVHNINPERAAERTPVKNLEVEEPEFVEELVDVPYEYFEEEIREQEVMKDEVVEKMMPQIKALYPYKGQGMEMEKGEVMLLLQKTNNDWWSARRANGQDGYVPANYVKEIEPTLVKRVVKRPVKQPVKMKVKKTGVRQEMVRKKKPSSSLRRTPSARSQANLHFDKVNVEQRQQAINNNYRKLCGLSQQRRKNLEDAIVFFKFCRECDNFESWMIDKEQLMQAKESLSENMEAVKRKYELLMTDLAANSHTIDDINKMADDILKRGHSKADFVKKRRKEINDRWNRLNSLKLQKEKTLKGASGIEVLQKMCDELKDWIAEKDSGLNLDDSGHDSDSVQALQRKHQNLEQELRPLEEKMNKMNLLAKSVKDSYPDEAKHIDKREKEIMDLWKALQDKARDHKKQLDATEEKHKFKDEANDLDKWINATKAELSEKQIPHDVKEAEEMIKRHNDLKDDIDANKERFDKLHALGNDILRKNPNDKAVKDKLQQLEADRNQIDDLWKKKNKQLKDALELQNFLREADQIDSVMASNEAFLDFTELGISPEDVEQLMKRHEDFESSLRGQDEKVKALDELADRLIKEGHPDANLIDERRKQAKARRDKMKKKCDDRRKNLQTSQALQEFKRDAEELADWIKEKYVMATDESYRDRTNLLPKLQKHQAFEAELKTNKDRLDKINKDGNDLVKARHYASPEIKETLGDLNRQWDDLYAKSKDKGLKLRQAAQQELFNQALEDANAKLAEMERLVSTDDLGRDLRGVRDLLKKHQLLEKEMSMNADNLKSIVEQGHQMAREGHFDSAAILKAVKDFDRRFTALQKPMENRRQKLEASLKWHQYNFDVDSELQWIKEHLPAATSTDYGANLVDVQKLQAKHRKLEVELQGHQPIIEKVIAQGNALVGAKHFASEPIKEKTHELEAAWKDLLDHTKTRKSNLNVSQQKHKYLSEVMDVETWLSEKRHLLSGEDYGKDENAADKYLTKLKAVEADLKAYDDIIKKLATEAKRLHDLDPVQCKDIPASQAELERRFSELMNRCKERRWMLEASKSFHLYMRESWDLENWITEQLQVAMSEEYGQDYEHLQTIHNRFSEFQLGIDAGSQQFKRVDNMATQLVDEKNPNSPVIIGRQEQLRNDWQQLLEQVEIREQKLRGAGEIHRFNRDVEDTLSRIQEKYSSIPEDRGKDLRTVQSYMKSHEGFENDLVPLAAQVQVLVDDSHRLQNLYGGGNAEHIAQQENIVVENWGILQEQSICKKEELEAALDLYWFMSEVKDLMQWAEQIYKEMKDEEPVRDVAVVERKLARHKEIKAEIETREENFEKLAKNGRQMIEAGHFASTDIQEKVREILAERDKLQSTWKSRKSYLEKLMEQQMFYRDANQLHALSTSQEAYLKGTELGSTVDQVEMLIKKHEAFENVLASQDPKWDVLQEAGQKMIDEKHFDSANIKAELQSVFNRRQNVKAMSADRRNRLTNNLLYAHFCTDVAEADGWIEDKLKLVKAESFKQVRDLQDKLTNLKKHQAFEAEILANSDRIKDIQQKGEELLKRQHEASPEIQRTLNSLVAKWNELLRASSERGKGLEEAKDILKFNEEVDKVESWIREKEALIGEGELGRDYEDCLELQKKINDVEGGVTVDEARVKDVNKLADKLISQGRTDVKYIQQKKDDLNKKWNHIQGALKDHKRRLASALEVHAFDRDVNDINDRINEKALAMSVDDYGKDLASIQALQRKQEDMEKDMTALHQQLQKMDELFGKLAKSYPDMMVKSEEKLRGAHQNWENLEDLAAARKRKLDDAYQLHRFLADCKEHLNWSENFIRTMNAGDLGRSVLEADEQLQAHLERKEEIAGRHGHYATLKQRGEKLISKKQTSVDEIQKMVVRLQQAWEEVNDEWDKRKQFLTQQYDLQVYEEYAEQAISWLSSKEAFLANDDLGNSLSEVEALIKKHDVFISTVEAQGEKITTLEQLAQALLAQKHYASDQIKTRCEAVVERLKRLQKLAAQRRLRLVNSKTLHQFLCNVNEVIGWVNEKMQIATDESYREPVNLQGKTQKHQTFEAELAVNKKRVEAVTSEGQELIRQKHYAQTEIKTEIERLDLAWRALLAASQEKKERLQQAYQALLFHRQCDELDNWMDDVEGQLASEDHGKDMTSVNSLLKKHQVLEEEISKHQDKMKQIYDTAVDCNNKKHFMADELLGRAEKIQDRYNNLTEPCQIRRDNLDDSLMLYTFYRDVEDELSWIREKYPVASLTDLGDSLQSVHNLQKKHQALESEIVSHEPMMDAVDSMASQMIAGKHPATRDIQSTLNELHSRMQSLKDLVAERKVKLNDSLDAHKFYAEADEAVSWMNDKKPNLLSKDLGKDEDSVQALLKKLTALEVDIENFKNTIGELAALCQGLVARDHYDSDNIQAQQRAIETQHRDLEDLIVVRRKRLQENGKLFEYMRMTDDAGSWIKEREAVAEIADCGTDLEHVQMLEDKFKEFHHDMLVTGEDRLSNLNSVAQSLMTSGHSDSSSIEQRQEHINRMWDEVKELAENRLESLSSAKKVHAFVRDADDAIEWIEEKELLVSSEDFGHDLESVQALIVKHEGFEQDLEAIGVQVESITNKAKDLIQQFPDAQEHIHLTHEQMVKAWNQLVEKANLRKEHLNQAESVQLYLDDYRNLCAWCNEMLARITADELAKDVQGAELLLTRHKENKAEIDARLLDFKRFTQKGRSLIADGHFMSAEIQAKIDHLNQLLDNVQTTWHGRLILYEQNLDLEMLKREMDQLDAWMNIRSPILKDKDVGDSIDAVEEMLQKHKDFEQMVYGQEERFNAIKRLTKLEQAFVDQKKREEQLRVEEEKRREKEKLEEKKRKEQERILEERRREEEQRKAQEILQRRRKDIEHEEEMEEARRRPPLSEINQENKHLAHLKTQEVDTLIKRTPSFNDQNREPTTRTSESEAPVSPVSPYATKEPLQPATKTSGLVASDAWKVPGETPRKKVAKSSAEKKEKRTRTLSLKTKKATPALTEYKGTSALPPSEIEGFLDRKQLLQGGGKKATIRSWKCYYTVLCGQLLCFFKDKQAFAENAASAPPLALHSSQCEIATDYTKKKNVLRLKLLDGSEYLFMAQDQSEMVDWLKKVQFHAALPPSLQLLHYDADLAQKMPHSPSHSTSSRGPPSFGDSDRSSPIAKQPLTTSMSDPFSGGMVSPGYSSRVEADMDQRDRTDGGYRIDVSGPSHPLPRISEVPDNYPQPTYDKNQNVTGQQQYAAQPRTGPPPHHGVQLRTGPPDPGYQRRTVHGSQGSDDTDRSQPPPRSSYAASSTLPAGTTPPQAAGGDASLTLERDAKGTRGSKSEKSEKKGRHGVFSGIFGSKKEKKDKDAKK